MVEETRNRKAELATAIAGYREVQAEDPGNLASSILLGAVLQEQLRLEEAAKIYREALEHHPNEERLHKQLVNVMMMHQGPHAVFRHYRLVRRDSRHLTVQPAEILCCIVLRNELPRLPYFLEYYRRKGVRTFFAVDNGSSDGSFEYLLKQPDVYLWHSDLSFNRANFGAGWFEPILRTYGRNHWCLIVDADEVLYYPECEHRTIADLCRHLDQKRKRAFNAVHLDMYSDAPVRDTHYIPGRPFEEACPYFDRDFYHECKDYSGPFHNQKAYFGGVRRRVFGKGFFNYLSKVPLLKYDQDCILAGGQHWTNLPTEQIAVESGCLLHFKFFSSFHDYVSQEVRRKEHSGNAMQYREYERVLQQQPSLTLFDPAHSVRLENSWQLIRLGVMQEDQSADAADAAVLPKIGAVPVENHRSVWTFILSLCRRTSIWSKHLATFWSKS